MSASGDSTQNLIEEGEAPTAAHVEGIPSSSLQDQCNISRSKDVEENTLVAAPTNVDSLEDAKEIEVLIEKRLPGDKEKGLDTDSELDFELKWDDDADFNDKQNDDADLDTGKKPDSLKAIEKDLDHEKEVDSALTSTEKDLVVESLDKQTDSTFTSIDKDLDSLDKDVESTSKKINLDTDKETENILTSIAEHLSSADEEIMDTKTTEQKDSTVDNGCTTYETDNKADTNTVASISDNLSKTKMTLDEDIINTVETREDTTVTTSAKVDIINLIASPVELETNSLDEELVYSDAEDPDPDIEDKELMDELEAEITATDIDNDKIEPSDAAPISDCLAKETVRGNNIIKDKELMDELEAEITATDIDNDKIEPSDAAQISDCLTKETVKDNNITKDAAEMEVDTELTNSSQATGKSDPLDTIASITDMDTSSYEINNEHGLDKPDVMLEIPTQELIDTFDDSDETSDKGKDDDVNFDKQSVTDIIDNLDLAEASPSLENTDKSTSSSPNDKATRQEIISNTVDEANVFNNLLTNEGTDIAIKLLDNSQTESMEVDTNVYLKEIEEPPEGSKLELSSNFETDKSDLDKVSTQDENVSHADIILEANSTELKVTEKTTVLEELDINKDAKVMTSSILGLKEVQVLEENKEVRDVDSGNLELKKLKDLDVNEPEINKEPNDAGNLHLKEGKAPERKDAEPNTLELTEVKEPAINKEVKDLKSDDELKEDKGLEVNNEGKEAYSGNLQLTEVKEQEVNNEIKELETDNLEPKPVTETPSNEAQPSTSKYHQESSDEDQELTDSLGLLAESSRVMEDDDEQEQEAEPDDDEDDDDFDQDDESNQMVAENSEESNAQTSEADLPKGMEVDESSDAQQEDSNDVPEIPEAVVGDSDDLPDALPEDSNDIPEADTCDDLPDETMDHDDNDSNEKDDMGIQIAAVLSQDDAEAVTQVAEIIETPDATEKAVEALLEEEKNAEDTADVPETTTNDTETGKPTKAETGASELSKLRQLLLKEKAANKDEAAKETIETEKKSPSKTKKFEIAKPKTDINIVDLGSSSEDDVQVVNKKLEMPTSPKDVAAETDAINKSASAEPKLSPKKSPKSTNEAPIKTAPPATPAAAPETKTAPKTAEPKAPVDLGLEIFSLDSDDEETEVRSKRKSKPTAVELDKARQTNKCINGKCTSDGSIPLVPASISAALYYAANQQRGGGVCLYCAKRFEERCEKLVEGAKDDTPFLSMDMCMIKDEYVQISDSDSEEETDVVKGIEEALGEKGAKFLEDHLADMFNETWEKFNMDARLMAAQAEINIELSHLQEESKEVDAMLNECQRETDKLRNDLYAAFADDRKELPAITIIDTHMEQWSGLEDSVTDTPPAPAPAAPEIRERPKRRSAPPPEPPAKRQAIPLGYAPLDSDAGASKITQEAKPVAAADAAAPVDDDNADISVVKLSVESAPAGLPGPGVPTRPPLRPHMRVYAMRNSFGAWHLVKIQEVQPKMAGQFTMCRVRFELPKTVSKLLPARNLAYEHAPDVRLTIGTRVVALFKDHRASVEKNQELEKKEAYYSGIVAEIPNPVNNYRYLIFFDDGYAQYVQHANTRLVCECAQRVWDEVHPFSRNFVRDYLRAYPERPMVRLHAGQTIKTEWDGKWWTSKVLQVDASLVLVQFETKKDNKTEWIYRGSTRLMPLYLELQAAERTRARPLPRAQAARRYNMPYVEYTRSEESADKSATAMPVPTTQIPTQSQIEQEIRRQRAVAKKSTALPAPAPAPAHAPAPAPAPVARENVTSRVVFYTPKNAIRPHKMVPHTCGPRCKRTDVLALKDLRTYNPLTKPLLSGWERQQVKYRIPAVKAIMYRAPCGRRIRNYEELHRYLQAIDSDMGVDLFDFNPSTHCLAEFLLNKCLISKKDLSHGKENVPVPCVNYYDSSLPEFCSYNTERTPTAGVPLNLDPEFLCGCDCTDDCADKSKCACWKMTLEGARTIGLDTNDVGYVYKRLPEPLPSGIYECNSRCKCKQTCLNRVAQHPLQLKLQVFKTANRGWGIRALNDVPKGAFLCVYAGNLLTDATANLDGLNEGDEYLAELDYIEVVEAMKEGFEDDIPDDAKKLDEEDESSELSSSEEEPERHKSDADDDFRPTYPPGLYTPSEYSKRLRKREKSKKAKEKEAKEKKEKNKDGDDCITISDDEELREPAHFSAQANMKGKEFKSKHISVRTLFGKDEACYIMDAKVQGNIGRYLNHSCTPNVFVQNVFVDSHDPRFPWVAFFALSSIRAGTELTWNYNYDVGSVPGKVLYCYCNAPNCRGRLL